MAMLRIAPPESATAADHKPDMAWVVQMSKISAQVIEAAKQKKARTRPGRVWPRSRYTQAPIIK